MFPFFYNQNHNGERFSFDPIYVCVCVCVTADLKIKGE